jgi:hypothetical protein
MKTPKIFIIALLTLLAATPAMASPESEAEAVLIHYFDALSQGDVFTLRSLMAGDLLKKRSLLLNNPTYPAFLISTFGNVRFRIDNVELSSSTSVIIDASIIDTQDNIAQRRYILRKIKLSPNSPVQFHIYDDSIPSLN